MHGFVTLSQLPRSSCTALRVLAALALLNTVGAGSISGLSAESQSSGAAPLSPRLARGQTLYVANCAGCHGTTVSGGRFGPALVGGAFGARWIDTAAPHALLDFVSANMPPADHGRLDGSEYGDIVGYLFHLNGATDPASIEVPPVRRTASPEGAATTSAGSGRRTGGPTPARPEVFADTTYRNEVERRKALRPVTDAMLIQPAPADWLHWRGSYSNIAYSQLTQINRDTVSALTVAWAWSLPVGVNLIAPLVHDGVLFISSLNQVQALEAATGTLLWRYERQLATQDSGAFQARQRNFALYGNAVFISTSDRHVVALDARTGQTIWDTPIIPSSPIISGPIAVRGKIIIGTSLCGAGGCYIIGLDARTGQQIWRANTIEQSQKAGGNTWNDAPLNQRTQSGAWIAGSYDPGSNLVYFGTGNTYFVSPLLAKHAGRRRGNNDALYTNTTLALDPDSGRLVWHHQHMPRDLWDLDEVFERSLITLSTGGKTQELLINIGKLGIIDALDRRTGAYVFSKDLGLQNVVTAIDPGTGRRSINPALAPRSDAVIEVCPSPEGARNWMSTAYNPRTQILFVPLEETCMDYSWHADFEVGAGTAPFGDYGWSVKPVPGSDGKYARVEAIDLVTRKSLWRQRTRAPLASSLLASDGGLIFVGDRDRNFRALDDRSGATLWETRLDAVPNASPIEFSAEGRQFIAITTGGGGPHDSESVEITPEIHNSAPATTVWMFALPAWRVKR